MTWLLLAAVFVVLVVAIFRGGGPPPPLIGRYANSPGRRRVDQEPAPKRMVPPPSGSKVRRYTPEGAVDSRVRNHMRGDVGDGMALNCRCALPNPPPTAKWSDFERAVLDEINGIRLFGGECQHVGTVRNDDGQVECIACGHQFGMRGE